MLPKRIKTLRGHTAKARYLATLQHKDSGNIQVAGYLAGHFMPAKPRYAYSPAYEVYRTAPADMRLSQCIVIIETFHAQHDVWAVEPDLVDSEEVATQAYLASLAA
jgi:hypothetical protein